MATELAQAYITLIPTLKGAQQRITQELSGIDTSSSGKAIGKNLTDGFLPSVKTAAKTATGLFGSIGGALGSLAARGGMTRALNIDQAKTMFKGLKLEWKDYEKSINDAVDGTAFSMDEAALVASKLAASGVGAGKQMDTSLRGAVGAAATFGANLGEIGSIYQKVAANGKLQGDELMQLSDRGINALSVLSQHLGKSQQDVRKMVSEGKIDFETFSTAMEKAFGDSAQMANETFSGSMANMRSALSRIGEKFAEPIRKNAIPVFNSLRLALNAIKTEITPLADGFASFTEKISGALVSKIDTFTNSLNNGRGIIGAFIDTFGVFGGVAATVIGSVVGIGAAFGALSSVVGAIPGLNMLVGALSGGAGTMGLFSGAAKIATTALHGIGGGVTAAIGKLISLSPTLSLISANFIATTATANTFGGKVKALIPFIGGLSAPILAVVAVIGALVAAFVYLMQTNEEFRNQVTEFGNNLLATLKPAIDQLIAALSQFVATLLPALIQLFNSFVPVITMLAQAFMQVFMAVAPLVAQLISTLMPVLTQLITLIANVVTTIINIVLPVIQAIVDAINVAMPFIQTVIDAAMSVILTTIQNVWPVIQAIIETVMNVIQSVIQVVMGIVHNNWFESWEGIQNLFISIWNGIQNILNAALGFVWSMICAALDSVKSIWDSIWGAVGGTLQSCWDGIVRGVSDGCDSVINFISGLPDTIMGFFAGVGDWLFESGKSLLEGFFNGIQSIAGSIGERIGGVLNDIRGFFPFSPAKKGPFSGHGYTTYSGKALMGDFGESIVKATPNVTNAMDKALSEVQGKFDAQNYQLKSSFTQNVKPSGYKAQDSNTSNYYSFGDIYIEAKDLEDMDTIDKFVNMLKRSKRVSGGAY